MTLQPKSRVGLVGPNGSGKTTLLKIINGLEEADRVVVEKRSDVTIGYLPQEGIVLGERPVIEEVESAASNIQDLNRHLQACEKELESTPSESPEYGEILARLAHLSNQLQDLEAHKLQSKAEKILFGLGFTGPQLHRPCREFSGGWQMRIALARLLLEEPDLLMMDEPTNHLDLHSLRWLESFLSGFEGSVLVISHDRTLLDQLCTSILSIEGSGIVPYSGNYSSFLEQRQQRLEQMETARKSQERKIAHTEKFIERFRYKATKARQVQSRIKALDKIERIESEATDARIHFQFPISRKGGHSVMKLEDIHKTYGPTTVFSGLSLEINRGDRIGVVGLNGAGKSTLARILSDREELDSGTIETGYQIDRGYFAQDQGNELDPRQSVFAAASAPPVKAPELRIRSVLGAFLFSGDDMQKSVGVLSGGEKNRLALARLLLCPANFLILDEPTNHLDMSSKEVLQEALLAFPGTTFIVSHDRHFLNPIVNRILEIQPGKCRSFPGNLEDYLWKIDQDQNSSLQSSTTRQVNQANGSSDSENPKDRRRRLARQQEAMAPLKKRLSRLEETISSLESKIASREQQMADKAFFEKGEETASRLRDYDQWKSDLTARLEEWERTAESLSALENNVS